MGDAVRMDPQPDHHEQNETGDSSAEIRERLESLHKKTSALNRTLDGVEETLKKAKGDLEK